MFKDITIGQYYPTDSVIHKLDPRTKIIFTLVFIVLLFLIQNLWGYIAASVFLIFVVALSKIPGGYVLRGLKGLIIIILITMALNMFMTPGTVIFQWGVMQITVEGIRTSIYLALRLILLVAGTSVMTLATSPLDITDGMESCMKRIPLLKRVAHELAMMMSIALRFIPTLMEETEKIMKAQKARGADFESGNLIERAKALVPILVPLFVSSFRRADELATAMEARCYRGGENRTRMHQLKYAKRDAIAYVIMIILIFVIVGSRFVTWPMPFPFG